MLGASEARSPTTKKSPSLLTSEASRSGHGRGLGSCVSPTLRRPRPPTSAPSPFPRRGDEPSPTRRKPRVEAPVQAADGEDKRRQPTDSSGLRGAWQRPRPPVALLPNPARFRGQGTEARLHEALRESLDSLPPHAPSPPVRPARPIPQGRRESLGPYPPPPAPPSRPPRRVGRGLIAPPRRTPQGSQSRGERHRRRAGRGPLRRCSKRKVVS